jgi:hypothetical protein
MIRTAILAVAALIALPLNAGASQQHRAVQPICDNMDVMRPCAYQPNFLAGIRSRPTRRKLRQRNFVIGRKSLSI